MVFVLVAMVILEVKLQGVSVAFGVAGAGIAFALQEVIVSIAGYIAIVTSGFYETGDRVQLGGVRGDVIDIGILRTTVMAMGDWVEGDLYNGKMVRVANSFVFKEPVYNYSGDFPFLWDEIKIPIKTTGDYKLAKELILKIANTHLLDYAKRSKKSWDKMTNNYRLEDATLEPMVSLVFNENWITITLRYIVDCKKRRFTQTLLYEEILDAIRKNNSKIQVASSAIEVTNVH